MGQATEGRIGVVPDGRVPCAGPTLGAVSTAVLTQDIVEETTDSAPGSVSGGGSPDVPRHRRVLRALNAGLVLTAVGQTAAAVVSLVSGRVVLAVLALATLPALLRLRRELRRRLMLARGGWWPVPFTALATLATLLVAVLWAGSP